MTGEERIEIAEQSYLQSIALIKNLYDARRGEKKIDAKCAEAVWYFDATLQGVLIYASLQSGRMTDETRTFIQNITISGNFMNIVNTVGPRKLYRQWEKLTWDNVITNTMPRERYLDTIKETVMVCVRSYIFPIVQFDEDITSRDYGSIFSGHMKKILHAVCAPDPEKLTGVIPDPDERRAKQMEILSISLDAIDAGSRIFNDAFTSYWKDFTPLD